ncbi:glycine zipper family protein [Thalassomonas sp. M1454]|uniref:glycine zipper family protein n=1 Tax=Thalassomonas sp. M1454 TaxID=2594477 RepID=UPI001180B166|nr:glycine zipper family protein [Thalassomonas sp. M1454]TRX56701.1 glycine zipper family protein [Thalassomonas sp. M1454]
MFSKSFNKTSNFVKETSGEVFEKIKVFDEKTGASDKATKILNSLSSKVKKNSFDAGGNAKKGELTDDINETVFIPVNNKVQKYGISDMLSTAKNNVVYGYGVVRGCIKNYNEPKDAKELLVNTREELIYINSCILQVSKKDSEQLASNFGKAISAKVAGIASAGGLFALVSSFGSASTGTAIAGLSGAAANSATLAWIGSLVGGGMAAGAVVTSGVGLLVGAVAYSALSSEPRDIEKLSDEERKIIESSALLIAAIDEVLLNNPVQLSLTEAKVLLNDVINPLNEQLKNHKNMIMEELNETNKIRFQEHALTDFQGNVVNGFKYYIKNTPYKMSPVFAISGVVFALLSSQEIEGTPENLIAIEALKRMNNEWSDYTHSELGAALSSYSLESLKGVANNAKGIYHELLYVDEFNRQNVDQQARLFEKTNEPGADIQIYSVDTGEIIQEAQLKALQDSSGIYQHFDKYPDIEVIATNEIASLFDNVEASGLTNEELIADMNSVISKLSSDTPLDAATDTAAFSLLFSAGKEAIEVLRGQKELGDAGKETALNVSVAASSTLLASYLFS